MNDYDEIVKELSAIKCLNLYRSNYYQSLRNYQLIKTEYVLNFQADCTLRWLRLKPDAGYILSTFENAFEAAPDKAKVELMFHYNLFKKS